MTGGEKGPSVSVRSMKGDEIEAVCASSRCTGDCPLKAGSGKCLGLPSLSNDDRRAGLRSS